MASICARRKDEIDIAELNTIFTFATSVIDLEIIGQVTRETLIDSRTKLLVRALGPVAASRLDAQPIARVVVKDADPAMNYGC